MINSRQLQIVQLVNDRGTVSVSELAQLTQVSEVTVRQDLTTLARNSYIKRAHGFAHSVGQDDVGTRMQTRFTLKKALAGYAASLVSEGETVFIEGGSTNALLARALADNETLTLVTVSHYIAGLLKEARCEVIILGGLYQKGSESVVGPLTRACVQQIHFQKAFIGVDGWHADTGFTGFTGKNMLRCDTINAVMDKGIETIALTDSSKFGQIHPYPLALNHQFQHVVTDTGIKPEHRVSLEKQAVKVHLVSDASLKRV